MSEQEHIRELEEALRERDAIIAELRKQIEQLRDELDAWKRGHRIRPGGKLSQRKKKAAPPQKLPPGRKKGHQGKGRKAPEHIDRFFDVPPPPLCPFCQGQVAASDAPPGLQRVEEIVPGCVEVIGYRRHAGRCLRCGKELRAPLPGGLGHNPKLGLRAQALLVEAKTELGLTLGQLQKMMCKQYGLLLSQGGIQHILHCAAQTLKPALAEIRAHLEESQVAWADETPLRVWGESGYLWLVMTREMVLFEADRSRGKEVPRRLLKGFSGGLHTDFYGSYFCVDWVIHLTCWAHLLREVRQLAERERRGNRAKRFYERVRGIYREAAEAQRKPERALEAERLKGKLLKLSEEEELGRHPEVKRLQKRLRKHCEDLLRFVVNPEYESTNNRAERELRLIAMTRHVSGGARSEEGARTFATLFSVSRTLSRQGKELWEFFQQARAALHNGATFPPLKQLPASPLPLN